MDVLDQFCVSLLLRWYLCACSSEGVSAQTTRSAMLGGLFFEMSGSAQVIEGWFFTERTVVISDNFLFFE